MIWAHIEAHARALEARKMPALAYAIRYAFDHQPRQPPNAPPYRDQLRSDLDRLLGS